MSETADNVLKLDCVVEGGGVVGAFADGCIERLLQGRIEQDEYGDPFEALGVEIATLSVTSAGMTTGLRVEWSQGRALDATGKNTGNAFRAATAGRFKKSTDFMWQTANDAADFTRNIEAMTRLLPDWIKPDPLYCWLAQSHVAAYIGNASNAYLAMLQATLPGIVQDLANPQLARLVSNCVDIRTGEEILTMNRTLEGEQLPPNLPMHAASGIVPPFFAAIDGIYIDGAFRRNGPIRGAIAERSDTPLLRIALGKPDFKAYVAQYEKHALLRTRAAEAFEAVSEPLPTDRPIAEICYPHIQAGRGTLQLPTRDEVKRLRRLGWEAMEVEIQERGLLERLRPAAKTAAPLRLAA